MIPSISPDLDGIITQLRFLRLIIELFMQKIDL